MKRENDLEYIRRRLHETVGLHMHIAKSAGVAQATISRVFNGTVPRFDTALRLRDMLKKMERLGATVVVERPRLRRRRRKSGELTMTRRMTRARGARTSDEYPMGADE